MRRIIPLAVVALALAAATGLWLRPTDPAIGSIAQATISTMELHANADAAKLADTTVAQAY
jgi:hypothetical protein